MSFQERLIFFTSEATLGIFCLEKSTVFIAISSNCEFVKIFDGDSSIIHLTRFCPLTSITYVKKLLSFRNQYANRPYLTDRFHKSDSSVFLNSRTLRWASDLGHDQTDNNEWVTYRHADHSTAISICPFKKRLCYFSEATFIPDSVVGYFHEDSMKSELRATRHLTVLPLSCVPDNFLGTGSPVGISTEELSFGHITAIPSSIPNGATNSTSACDFFDEIEHELFVLKCPAKYPTSLGLAVRFESIDGDIFLCSASRSRVSDNNSSSDNTVGNAVENTIENTVENWINLKKKQITTISRKDKIDYPLCDLDSHMLANSDFGCNGGGAVLSLKGDYFTFYDPDPGLPNTGVTMHVSLLDCIDKEGMDETFSSHASESDIFDIRAILTRYRSNAIKLLEYREYLSPRIKALKRCHWVPHCLRPVDTTSSENIPRKISPQNVPQNASNRVLRNPISISSEFHFSQTAHSTACSRTYDKKEALLHGGKEVVPYGGTYCVRMGQLRRVDSVGFDSVIDDDRNSSSGSSSGLGSSCNGRGNNSGCGSSSSSSSSRWDKDIDRDRDRDADMDRDRNRYTPSSQYERDTVRLHSASGAKFTAYPFNSFQNPFSEGINNNGNGNHENKSEQYGNRRDGPGGRGVFSKVRGVFQDRTQIDLCLEKKVRVRVRVNASATINECVRLTVSVCESESECVRE